MLPQRDLRIHETGITLAREMFPHFQPTEQPRMHTHYDAQRNLFVRQKTDLYPFVNIFVEEFSNYHQRTIGGMFQAHADGCGDLMYYYPREGKIVFTLLNDVTIQAGRDLIQQYRFNKSRTKYIANNGYLTKGYTIPVYEYINWFGSQCQLVDVPPRAV